MNINDFISSIDNKLYNRLRGSMSDAECRRYLMEHAIKQLSIHGVSGTLPNDFKQLPDKLQCKLVRKHTHAELVDGEKIVYEEQDVLDIIKYVSEGNYR